MVHSSVGYCRCGYEIWVEYLITAGKWKHRFLNSDNIEIHKCPGCGISIVEQNLESA